MVWAGSMEGPYPWPWHQPRYLNLEHFYLTPGAARMVSNLLRRSGFLGVLATDLKLAAFSNSCISQTPTSTIDYSTITRFLLGGGGSLSFHSSIRSCQVNLWEVQPVSFTRLKSAMLRRTPFWRRGQRPPPEVRMMDVFFSGSFLQYGFWLMSIENLDVYLLWITFL